MSLYPERAKTPHAAGAETAPVMALPLESVPEALRQKVRMKGVLAMVDDIGTAPPLQVTPDAAFWVFQLVKSTKHNVEA